MTLSDLSIRNPTFAVMLAAGLSFFGILAYRDLGISQFPEIDFPVVTITTMREAASPEVMDFDVTDVIEDAISGIQGIETVQSYSTAGYSVVTVTFTLDRNVDAAVQDVQNAVAAAARNLPQDIDPPNVSKIDVNRFPVMWLAVHGDRPLKELNGFVDDILKRQMQSIPGVGGITLGGLRQRTMRVWLDRVKLQSNGIDAMDVWEAVRREHVEKPAGYLVGRTREMAVRTLGEARTEDDFRRMPILDRGNQLVRLGDIALVEDGLADKRTFSRFNLRPSVGVGLMRASGGNVVAICDEVRRRLPEWRRMAPPGVEISVSTDYSLFIRDDIAEVKEAMLLGVLLTAGVTFLFLGSLGTTLNVCLSLPTSLLGTFIALKWFGFTINFMTLLGLSLAVGVVVDDAILVLENIYRRREHGESALTAALEGAREIRFAALAATLAIVAIFMPVAFMNGAVGRMFFQFGVTVSVAVLISLAIALSLTPMLCSLSLNVRVPRRPRPPAFRGLFGIPVTALVWAWWLIDRWVIEPLLLRPVDGLINVLSRGYGWSLGVALRMKVVVVLGAALLASAALVFAFGLNVPLPEWATRATGLNRLTIRPLGRELVPSEDQNRFLISVICPVGSSIEYVEDMLARGEELISRITDPVTGQEVVGGLHTSISFRPGAPVSEGQLSVKLIPAAERTLTQSEIMRRARQELAKLSGMRAVVIDLSTQGFTPRRGMPIDFAVQGPEWTKVTAFAERVKQAMQNSGIVSDVDSDFRPGMPEVHLIPDRAKAAELGVSMRRVAVALNVGTGGVRDGRFTGGERRYDVRLRYIESQRSSPDQIPDIHVRSELTGQLVPLRDVTTQRVVSTLPTIHRYNHLRKVELTANVAPGVSQGEAIELMQTLAETVRADMGLPENYRIVQMGNASAMGDAIRRLWTCLGLGFLVAYMVLGVQFNSFVHPLTVLLAVPFAVTGALATLWVFGDTLNVMSMIGMVLLAGLVKKNSIVLVDCTNQFRARGLGLEEAIRAACPVRLRPILMTSLATVIGVVPLALGLGPGAETRAPMARSIIGGSVLATAVTLIVVPVFYILFAQAGDWFARLTRTPDSPGTLP